MNSMATPSCIDLAQALVVRDAVLDVDDIVADGEIAEVGDEGRGLRFFRCDACGDVGVVGEVVRTEDHDVCIRQTHAVGEAAAHDDRRAVVAGEIAGLVVDVFAAGMLGAAAEAIGHLIFAQQVGEALDFALVGRD